MPGHHRAGVGESGHLPCLCHVVPGDHHRGHGARPADADRLVRYSAAAFGYGRFHGRNAGPRMGGLVSRSRGFRHPHRLHHPAQRPADRLQRGGPPGHHGRPRLERRRLLRQAAARAGPGRGAHGGPHHLHERRIHAREIRPPVAGQGEVRIRFFNRSMARFNGSIAQ
jgi:hypothetical protein